MPAPKQPNTITQTNKVELSPEQKEIFGLAMPYIKQYASSSPQLYQGSGITDFNELQKAGQAGAVSAAQGMGGLTSAVSSAQQKLLDPDFMLNPNQYVKSAADAVTRGATDNLLENILPSIRSGATSAGGQYSGGSTRQGVAEGKAIQGTSREISDSLAKMFLSNYQTGLTGLGSAVNNNQNVMQQMLFPSSVMQAVGGQQQGMEQAKLTEMINNFYTQQDLPLLQSQQLLGLISGMPGATGTSTVTGAAPKTAGWQQALGLGTSLLSLMTGNPMGMTAMMGK